VSVCVAHIYIMLTTCRAW